jgi:dihydropteroate synthase
MSSPRARLGSIWVGDAYPVAVMGIVNRDPQSFYSKSYARSVKQVLKMVERMLEEGASFIDIGGQSTAPSASSVSTRVEETRVIPLISNISRNWDVPISVDTQRSEIAQKAVDAGATIINDVSGLKSDQQMAQVIKDAGASCILMASKHTPGDTNTFSQIIAELKTSLNIASQHQIPQNHIVLDPGIGFGKPFEFDLDILRNLQKLRILRQPLLIGISRKSFIGKILGYPEPRDRLVGSLAAVTFAILNGIHVIRTHDVKDVNDCVRFLQALESKPRVKHK